MNQAIEAYRHVSISPEFKELERMRSKAGHDKAQALHNAEQKGRREEKLEVARILMGKGLSIDTMMEATRLTRDEIEKLKS